MLQSHVIRIVIDFLFHSIKRLNNYIRFIIRLYIRFYIRFNDLLNLNIKLLLSLNYF